MRFEPSNPSFNVTRASHLVLNVSDLQTSREFYEKILGLIVTEHRDDAVFLRGIEEACHHSLVLRKSNTPSCARIGLRMFSEKDIEESLEFFTVRGCSAEWVEIADQGPTLHVTDPVGVPLEFCARMPVEPRMITRFEEHRGGEAQRIDHYQILTPNVPRALDFYGSMGFRLSEYIEASADDLRGVFLQRKGNPHDIVFFHGYGPQLHHFAYFTPEGRSILRACDIAGALGYGRDVERGPGRHGPGHAMFVYFRDPDGHRVELFNTHYQTLDIENEPIRWESGDPNVSFPWGLPAQRRWFEEATIFENTPVQTPDPLPTPLTLERFLTDSRK